MLKKALVALAMLSFPAVAFAQDKPETPVDPKPVQPKGPEAPPAKEMKQEKPEQEPPKLDPFFPGRRRGVADPGMFLDTESLAVGIRMAFVSFTSDFDTDNTVAGSLLLRAPSPWLSRGLLSMDRDDVGLFTELTVTGIDRQGVPNSETPDGTILFLTLGFDYQLVCDASSSLTVQAGGQYANFGGVTDTQDGVGLLIGLNGSWKVSDGLAAFLSPQMAFGNADDRIFFIHVGVRIEF